MKYIVILSLLLTSCITYEQYVANQPWDDGLVKYYLDDALTVDEASKVQDSIDYIQYTTNVRFMKMYANTNYVCYIYKGKNNTAKVGMKMLSEVELANFTRSTIVHELTHVLGLWHEHQREDRDEWVKVHRDRIDDEDWHNYKIRYNHLYDMDSIGYDYTSIMHYGLFEPGKDAGSNALEMLRDKGTLNLIGGLYSILDIEKINAIYPKE